MINLVIFGSRTVWPTTHQITDGLVKLGLVTTLHAPKQNEMRVYCGYAAGADEMGRRWAKMNLYDIIAFRPEWDKYGNMAGYHRNEEMAKTATHGLGFWDGESRGTANMCTHLVSLGKPVLVIRMNDGTEADGNKVPIPSVLSNGAKRLEPLPVPGIPSKSLGQDCT